MAQTVLHKADSRGLTDLGWLKSYHTFSFASYYNPERMNFGALRVLNDDIVAGGQGFGEHPHDNMEIISIPLKGDLKHRDSMNNVAEISDSDIQAMSAGTGIFHTEFNRNTDEEVKFLQIWVYPNQLNVEPRYAQLTLSKNDRHNRLQQVVSPNSNDDGIWIYQQAWFNLGRFDKGVFADYVLKGESSGVYAFIINGEVEINGQTLNSRDGFGIWEIEKLSVKALTDAEFLLMEVPMAF